jgi:hypothetical protein
MNPLASSGIIVPVKPSLKQLNIYHRVCYYFSTKQVEVNWVLKHQGIESKESMF